MNILLISPMGFAVKPVVKYAGIEKLVYQFAEELVKSHKVTVVGRIDSVYPDGVNTFSSPVKGDVFMESELKAYQTYQYTYRSFEVIHDFSHSHFCCRYNKNLPAVNPFWHAPALARYPKAPYNIVALSQWAAREFKRIYNQGARYQETIIIDSNLYADARHRGDRFLTIGRMSPEKGNLAAAMLCKELGVPLDVVGARGAEHENNPLTDYEKGIRMLCDGDKIKFHGEVDDDEKIKLMQRCRGLIYMMPQGYEEVTSHKLQEAMLCGAPVITSVAGATPEIVSNGVDGFLCNGEDEYKQAIINIDKLDPSKTRDTIAKRYSASNVIGDYVKLYEQVAGGLRW